MSKYKVANKKSSNLIYPDVQPTLDLNFVENQKVPPFINVVRNSQTTYVDKFGILRTAGVNQPVFEWDPITGECLGARIWGVVTNLTTNSADLSAASFARTATTVTATGTGPDGQAAYVLTETPTANTHSIVPNAVSVTSGINYTASIFLKRSTVDWVQLTLGAAGFGSVFVNFNLSNGTKGIESNCTGFIEPYVSGWYKCSIRGLANATLSTNQLIVAFTNNANVSTRTPSYTGSESNSVSAALPSFAASSVPVPYVPTTTTAASSTADVWSITGADFNRIYNQSAVTLYAEAERGVVPAGDLPVLVDARNAAASSIIQIGYLTENLAGNYVTTGNVLQAELYPTGLTGVRRRRIASAFGTNDVAISANGSVPLTDVTATMPTPDRINIGSVGGTQSLNGYIRQLKIFPKRLTNSQLRSLTR